MFIERKLEAWATELRTHHPVPLRLRLWDGRALDLADASRGLPPIATLVIERATALRHVLSPTLASLGKAYVEGEIDVEGRLSDVIDATWSLARSGAAHSGNALMRIAKTFRHTRDSDKRHVQYHYDVGNDFYRLWLDERMVYSCAYFARDDMTLAEAQVAKIDHILNKLRVQPNDRVLDIGCGWGALVIRAAQQWGARCHGVTLSQQQFDLATQRVREAGLQDRVTIELRDYRDLLPEFAGRFDKIASVGMFEHVGRQYLPRYFEIIRTLLRDGGLALNHGITSTDPDDGATPFGGGDFIDEYVFPHGELPHIGTVLKTMQQGGLEPCDAESLRRHYARTLTLWADNFERHADAVKKIAGDKRFRIWRVYLAGCAKAFSDDWISIFQVLACKAGGGAMNPLPMTRAWMTTPRASPLGGRHH